MKKLLSLFVSLILVLTAAPRIAAAEVSTSARAYALYCANNGELLLSQNPDERLPMASTTKIMTMLITLEIAEKEDRVVAFTDEMTAEGSSMYLKPGEKVRLSDLAAGMMMQSGNDAANAAAIAISGSIKRFVERMNQKARQLGMTNTRFVTPSGLDDEGHFSSARDLAVLMAYALKNDSFRKLTSQLSVTVRFAFETKYPAGEKVYLLFGVTEDNRVQWFAREATAVAGGAVSVVLEKELLELLGGKQFPLVAVSRQ